MRTCVILTAAVGASLISASVSADVTLSASMTVDNLFTASISDSPTSAGTTFLTGANWQQTFSGSFVFPGPGTYYLQIAAIDQGPPAMFIGQFSLTGDAGSMFSNGTASLLSGVSDWVVSNTGFGVNTVAPLDLGPNGTGPWGHVAGVDDAAHFVWAPTFTSAVYFSSVITVVPSPAGAAAIGIGVLALARRRR
jgi:hypothetical protein